MTPIAARLIAALRQDYTLFAEVTDWLAQIPRCGQWEPHMTIAGAFHRKAPDGSTVAVAKTNPAEYLLRGDIGVGKETLTLAQAMGLADAVLTNKGWMFPPSVG